MPAPASIQISREEQYARVLRLMSSGLEPERLIERLLETIGGIFVSEGSAALIVDHNASGEEELSFHTVSGEKREQLRTVRLKAPEGIAGWVLEHQQPQLVSDPSSDPRFCARVDKESGFRTREIMAVPLTASGRRIGVLEVVNPIDHSYVDEDLLLLRDVAETIAVVLANARLHAELRAKTRFRRSLTDSMLDLFFLLDRDLVIREANAAVSALGYRPYELPGRRFQDLLSPEEENGLLRKLSGCTAGRSVEGYEAVLVGKDARVVASVNATGVPAADGSLCIAVVARDMKEIRSLIGELTAARDELDRRVVQRTEALQQAKDRIEKAYLEIEKAYAELRETKDKLVQSEKMASIGELAAGVAHEINNPIAFVTSNLRSLRRYVARAAELPVGEAGGPADREACRHKLGEIVEKMRPAIEESIEGVERVSKIVTDLKEFAHVDSNVRVPVSIEECIEKALRICWNQLKYKLDVRKEIVPVPAAIGHPQQIVEVFINLFVNAAQAVPEKGTLSIRTFERDGHVLVEVADNGPGIPPEIRSRIFDPFFTTKPVGQGTGLGLSTVFATMRRHGGSIEVDSTVGKGATFTLAFPADTPQGGHDGNDGA